MHGAADPLGRSADSLHARPLVPGPWPRAPGVPPFLRCSWTPFLDTHNPGPRTIRVHAQSGSRRSWTRTIRVPPFLDTHNPGPAVLGHAQSGSGPARGPVRAAQIDASTHRSPVGPSPRARSSPRSRSRPLHSLRPVLNYRCPTRHPFPTLRPPHHPHSVAVARRASQARRDRDLAESPWSATPTPGRPRSSTGCAGCARRPRTSRAAPSRRGSASARVGIGGWRSSIFRGRTPSIWIFPRLGSVASVSRGEWKRVPPMRC